MNSPLELARIAHANRFTLIDQAYAKKRAAWAITDNGKNPQTPESEALHDEADAIFQKAHQCELAAAKLFEKAETLPIFEVTGYVQDGEVFSIEARATTTTRARAVAIAASFPKSLRVSGYGVTGMGSEFGGVSLRVSLSASRNNKGANEGGIDRLRRFLARVAHEFRGNSAIGNPATPEQLRAIVVTDEAIEKSINASELRANGIPANA